MRTNLKNLTIVNPTYLACIMWKDQYDRVYRYMLWDEIGEIQPLGYPLYTGQLIKKNFRIEIWSIDGNNITENVGDNLITSVLQGIDYRYGNDRTIGNSDGQVTNLGANASSVTNFPSSLDAFLQARWLATTAVSNQPWLSSDSHAWSLLAFGGTGFVTANDSKVSENPVVFIEGINLAVSVNINPSQVFMVMNIPAQGNATIYNFDNGAQVLVGTPGPAGFETLTLEDSNTVDVPLNTWIVLEVAYSAGGSSIRYFLLGSRTIYTQPTFTPTSTTITNRAVFSITNTPGCSYYLADIEVYIGYLGDNSQLVMTYIYNRYNYNFALPLMFPPNASSQPNTI